MPTYINNAPTKPSMAKKATEAMMKGAKVLMGGATGAVAGAAAGAYFTQKNDKILENLALLRSRNLKKSVIMRDITNYIANSAQLNKNTFHKLLIQLAYMQSVVDRNKNSKYKYGQEIARTLQALYRVYSKLPSTGNGGNYKPIKNGIINTIIPPVIKSIPGAVGKSIVGGVGGVVKGAVGGVGGVVKGAVGGVGGVVKGIGGVVSRGRVASRSRGRVASRSRSRAVSVSRGRAASRSRGRVASRSRGRVASRSRSRAVSQSRGRGSVARLV